MKRFLLLKVPLTSIQNTYVLFFFFDMEFAIDLGQIITHVYKIAVNKIDIYCHQVGAMDCSRIFLFILGLCYPIDNVCKYRNVSCSFFFYLSIFKQNFILRGQMVYKLAIRSTLKRNFSYFLTQKIEYFSISFIQNPSSSSSSSGNQYSL